MNRFTFEIDDLASRVGDGMWGVRLDADAQESSGRGNAIPSPS